MSLSLESHETIRDKIIALRDVGNTYRDIEQELNITRGEIAHHLTAHIKRQVASKSNMSREKKRKFLQDYKERIGCLDCGEMYPHYILEFDHLPEHDKIDTLSNLVSKSYDTILKELEKCEVVCSNCHNIRTYERSQNWRCTTN